MRLFVCSRLAREERAFYDEVVGRLVDRHAGLLRAIPRDSAHVTYAFIADLTPSSLPDTVEALRRALVAAVPVAVTVGRPEVLVAGRDARLIHAAIIDGRETLADLSDRIATSLERALPGVAISRSRSAHVTLARFRRGTGRREADVVREALARDGTLGVRPDRFTAVSLMSSELTGATPVYAVQAECDLSGA